MEQPKLANTQSVNIRDYYSNGNSVNELVKDPKPSGMGKKLPILNQNDDEDVKKLVTPF